MWIPLRSRVIHVEPFNQNGNTIGTTVSPSLGRCKKNARMRALGNKDSRNIATWITYTTFEASSFANTTHTYGVNFSTSSPQS